MPEELKDRFNGYQLETIIHPDCDTMEVSKLVRKYNNNKPMNTAQRAYKQNINDKEDMHITEFFKEKEEIQAFVNNHKEYGKG